MKFTRRALVAGAAAAPALAQVAAAQTPPGLALPAKAAFAKMPYVYLDSGSTHPMPLGARAALEEYLRYKTRDGLWRGYDMDAKEKAVLAGFGQLVGADADLKARLVTLDAEVRKRIEDAVASALNSPFPAAETAFAHVYA